MRRAYFIFSILACCILGADVNAAPARGGSARGGATATATSGRASAPVSARAATTGATKAVSARAATTPSSAKKTTAARAATTQKVVNTGTKVAAATTNTVVSENCKNQYYGCMDSFCMLDNTSGGRCLCSDRNADLNLIANEIQKLDEQTYAMATSGVERIEMGEMADDVIKQAKDVANSFTNTNSGTAKKRQSLDLTMWSSAIDFSEDEEESVPDVLEGKVGAGLHDAVYGLCSAQIASECNAELSMLKLMYSQQIKSDCTAYENSLKQQKNASTQKLMAAEAALRDAALEQYKSANKYDLGQCTTEFKKCMMTTAGCGDDFSACASMVALDNTNAAVKSSKKKDKIYTIKGAKSSIEISATTYDTLMAKKPICESVTKSCVKVKDKVWDTFLAEVAPQLKSAELIAEDNARQNCISSVSSCFQKACKDNIDPNDPDGSYDMCLTRPETMLSLCKVPLNACGISTDGKKYEDSSIWQYVVAAMASMRVDSCTNEFKECLQADTRCGKDYSQCIGLDFESIQSMCPLDKLVGCQQNGKGASFKGGKDVVNVTSLLQGIFLSVDNAMLDQCQKIVNEKMIEVCGDTATCMAFDDDEYLGTESLRLTKDENDFVISGMMSFGNVTVDKVNNTEEVDDDKGGKKIVDKTSGIEFGRYKINIDDYLNKVESDNDTNKFNLSTATEAQAMAKSSLEAVQSTINQTIALLSQDAKVKMCVEGRDMSQIRGSTRTGSTRTSTQDDARFPYLLDSSMLAIINSGLKQARINHTKKFNELVASAMEEQNDQVKQALCAAMASSDEPVCTKTETQNGQPICTEYAASSDYLSNLFGTSTKQNSTYATEYRIPGANLTNLVKLSSNANKEYIMTDGDNNMIGSVQMSTVYSAKNNTCYLTTTSLVCKNVKEIITTDTECKGWTASVGAGGSGCGGAQASIGWGLGSTTKKTKETYQGTICTEFEDPIVTTQDIKM